MHHLIIPCAGRGSRLGRGVPKAGVKVGGKTILTHILDALPPDCAAHVIAGFNSHTLGVNCTKPPIVAYFNPDWETTNINHSIAIAARQFKADDLVTIMDGDIIPHPASLPMFLEADLPCIGIRPKTNDPDPVRVRLIKGDVVAMGRDVPIAEDRHPEYGCLMKVPNFEWACIATVYAGWFHNPTKREMWEQLLLPQAAIRFEGVEIDDEQTLIDAESWLALTKK